MLGVAFLCIFGGAVKGADDNQPFIPSDRDMSISPRTVGSSLIYGNWRASASMRAMFRWFQRENAAPQNAIQSPDDDATVQVLDQVFNRGIYAYRLTSGHIAAVWDDPFASPEVRAARRRNLGGQLADARPLGPGIVDQEREMLTLAGGVDSEIREFNLEVSVMASQRLARHANSRREESLQLAAYADQTAQMAEAAIELVEEEVRDLANVAADRYEDPQVHQAAEALEPIQVTQDRQIDLANQLNESNTRVNNLRMQLAQAQQQRDQLASSLTLTALNLGGRTADVVLAQTAADTRAGVEMRNIGDSITARINQRQGNVPADGEVNNEENDEDYVDGVPRHPPVPNRDDDEAFEIGDGVAQNVLPAEDAIANQDDDAGAAGNQDDAEPCADGEDEEADGHQEL